MKWLNLIPVALLLCSVTACNETPRSEQIRQELLNPTSKQVLVVSHRADWRNYPENSMEAIIGIYSDTQAYLKENYRNSSFNILIATIRSS